MALTTRKSESVKLTLLGGVEMPQNIHADTSDTKRKYR
jgi:hypothetical protein